MVNFCMCYDRECRLVWGHRWVNDKLFVGMVRNCFTEERISECWRINGYVPGRQGDKVSSSEKSSLSMKIWKCKADWVIWRNCRLLDIDGMKSESEEVVREEQEVK